MVDIYLTNSFSGKKEKFVPLNPDRVGVYTCGPTVYDYASIGNFRTYTTADVLVRTLKYNGFDVKYVMNLTDVGHLTGDNLGDADTGEDRLEKAARREGKNAWEIAKYYSKSFIGEMQKLNLTPPDVLPKATDHIKEQIELVKRLEDGGFTYKTSDGIYFDTKVYEKKTGKKYGQLSTLKRIKEGARVKKNPEKKNARDFALWKLSPKEVKRQMEWDSPWGVGFPGWHIECSAMSMKYLGESFDIHLGGEDLRSTHHPNEIAQSEAATGKQFVKYWLHATFLQVDGKRMGKSIGNMYSLADIENKGHDALALRYLYLTSYWRDTLNFTWTSLEASQNAYNNLKQQVAIMKTQTRRTSLSHDKNNKVERYSKNFIEVMNDDLNTPQALAVLWEVLKSNIPSEDKYDLVILFDEVLGLRLSQVSEIETAIPRQIIELIEKREEIRNQEKWEQSDKIREEIYNLGYEVKDTPDGPKVRKINR